MTAHQKDYQKGRSNSLNGLLEQHDPEEGALRQSDLQLNPIGLGLGVLSWFPLGLIVASAGNSQCLAIRNQLG